ncbi:MAG: nucleotide sugar dehydrogenase [Ignavibacteria bacterium]|nr:nucleotide sugar dehydrogenase [Ignavibacteria bacterium]
MKNEFLKKIDAKEAVVGIVGLGYVGLPLMLCFAEKGFHVVGLDVDSRKTTDLMNGKSYIKHIPAERIRKAVDSGLVKATVDYSEAKSCDAILICVPTPLSKNREPDLSYIVATCEAIAPHLRKGQLIVLESTTYPGTTEEVMVPLLEKSGLKTDRDIYVGFSPEREDPNRTDFSTASIPKVVGATSPDGLAVAKHLYEQVIVKMIPVSSPSVAEATKLMENIFRSVNIALVNELKVTFMKMGIDIWEVIEAAKTKPFGYMPFYPGPGLGGHCIPIDPFYLTWKAREYDVTTKFIELAGEINTAMPDFVVSRVMEVLNMFGKPLKGSKILLMGLAYKSNVDDDRESPSYHLIEKLEGKGATVSYHDPHVPEIRPSREYAKYAGRTSVPVETGYDLILISTAHDAFQGIDWASLKTPIVDTRNLIRDGGELVFKA